jgi:hypothetical protein
MFKKLFTLGLSALFIGGLLWGMVAMAATRTAYAAGLDAYGSPGPRVTAGSNNTGYGMAGRGTSRYSGIALDPLSEAETEALIRAMQEEANTQTLYQSVLDTFGNVAPFNYIVRAEAQHLAALERLATKYGVAIPETLTTGDFPTFTTLSEACQAGAQAEIADAALYDELIPVTTHSDLLQVYRNLQGASLNNHLPAFEACQ